MRKSSTLKLFSALCMAAVVAVDKTSAAQSQTIDLDPRNVTNCLNTLYSEKPQDQLPLILYYDSESPWPEAKEQLKNYEEIAAENPNRAFFKYEMNKMSFATFRDCLRHYVTLAVGGVVETVIRSQVAPNIIEISNPLAATPGTSKDAINSVVNAMNSTSSYKPSIRFGK